MNSTRVLRTHTVRAYGCTSTAELIQYCISIDIYHPGYISSVQCHDNIVNQVLNIFKQTVLNVHRIPLTNNVNELIIKFFTK